MSAVGAPRYSVLVRFGVETPVRAWAGLGDLEIPADDVEPAGALFLGIGLLGNAPALRQLIGGVAERLEFSLSVPSGEVFALADEEAASVRSAPVDVGVIFFDEDWQQSEVAWLWNGVAELELSGVGLDDHLAFERNLIDRGQRRGQATPEKEAVGDRHVTSPPSMITSSLSVTTSSVADHGDRVPPPVWYAI